MAAPGSLRKLLALWLVAPLLALILISAIPAYFLAVRAANDAYDNGLLDPATAIANYVRDNEDETEVVVPPAAIEALRIDTIDRIFFQVSGPDNEPIAGNARIPRPEAAMENTGQVLYSASIDGQAVRVAALSIPRRNGNVLVQVAETTLKRDRLVQDILVGAFAPAVLVAFVAAILFWFGIRQALAPLDQLRDQIERRSPGELGPVTDGNTPLEVKPLVAAINELLSRLAQALDAQQRFIANAAHQLRTPLAGLRTHVELMRRESSKLGSPELVEIIAAETERASHLANQLLTLARAEPGSSLPVARMAMDLRDLVSQSTQAWVPRAIARNIDLGFDLREAPISGDPQLLRELLANLLDNALIHNRDGGHVTARTRIDADKAILEVEDNGPGIPELEREKVFERFYRVPGTETEGGGLGLAIVREIADRHQARVELHTPESGAGLLVRVLFDRRTNLN
ncbi:MAG: sensor histidine kinase [Burkholderiales bacterium]